MSPLALVIVSLVAAVALWWRSDAKQRSRRAPDKDGWREPEFLLFDHAGGHTWFFVGLVAYGVVLLLAGIFA